MGHHTKTSDRKNATLNGEVYVQNSNNVLLKAFDVALRCSGALAEKQVKRMQEKHPHLSTRQQIDKLADRFLSEVTAVGAATGASAAAPGVGTAAALSVMAGDMTVFLTAACVYVQSVVRVLDIDIEDADHSRFLILTVLLGGSGSGIVKKTAERTGAHWGRQAVNKIPASSLKQVNKVLGQHFVTKYGTKQGILVLGKIVPFGAGALLGAGGNHLLGRATVKATKDTFREFMLEA